MKLTTQARCAFSEGEVLRPCSFDELGGAGNEGDHGSLQRATHEGLGFSRTQQTGPDHVEGQSDGDV